MLVRFRMLLGAVLTAGLLLATGVGSVPAHANAAPSAPANPGLPYDSGENNDGQLANPVGDSEEEAVPALGLSGITVMSVSQTGDASFALTNTGAVYAWGNNQDNELGLGGSLSYTATPTKLTFPGDALIVSLNCSAGSSCIAASTAGNLYSWGYEDFYGQPDTPTPAQVSFINGSSFPAGTQFLSGTVGRLCSYAVTTNHQVYAWGDNTDGCLGDGATGGVRSGPTLASFPSGVEVAGIAAGNGQALALTLPTPQTTGGQVYAWGENTKGEVGNGSTTTVPTPTLLAGLTGVTQVSANNELSMALLGSGTVETWGQISNHTNTEESSPHAVAFASPAPTITQINAEDDAAQALDTSTGEIYLWGGLNDTSGSGYPIPTVDGDSAVFWTQLDQGGDITLKGGFAIPDTLSISLPSTSVAGIPIGLSVTIHNPDGSVNDHYGFQLPFTDDDPSATRPSIPSSASQPGTTTYSGLVDYRAGATTLTAAIANVPGASARAVTQVAPGPVRRLTISPAGAVLTAGSSQGFTSEGYDAYGNDAGDQTSATSYSVTGGSCAANSCTPTIAGQQSVTAADNGAAATAGVTVVPAALDHITAAAAPFAHAGQIVPVTVSGFDRFGNATGNVTSGAHLSITPDGTCGATTCTPKSRGPHTITATEATPGGTMGSATATTTIAIGYATPGITHATLSVGDSQATITYGVNAHNLLPTTVAVSAVAAGHPTVTVRGSKTSGTLTLLHLLDGVHYTFGISVTGPSDAGTTTAALGDGTPARVPAVSLLLSHGAVHPGALVVLTGRLTLGREGIGNHAITLTAQAPHHRVVVLARGHTDRSGHFRFSVHPRVTQSYTVTATFGPRNRLTISRNKPTSVHVV